MKPRQGIKPKETYMANAAKIEARSKAMHECLNCCDGTGCPSCDPCFSTTGSCSHRMGQGCPIPPKRARVRVTLEFDAEALDPYCPLDDEPWTVAGLRKVALGWLQAGLRRNQAEIIDLSDAVGDIGVAIDAVQENE